MIEKDSQFHRQDFTEKDELLAEVRISESIDGHLLEVGETIIKSTEVMTHMDKSIKSDTELIKRWRREVAETRELLRKIRGKAD